MSRGGCHRDGGRTLARLLAAVLALSAPLAAHDYYVSPSGKGGNPGTLALPFRSVAHGVRQLHPGDTLYLRQGVYREAIYIGRGGSAAAPIVIRGFPKECAILAGSDLVAGPWRRERGNIWSAASVSATSDLYVDGREMPMARWPAVPPGAPMDQGWALSGPGTDGSALLDPGLPALPLAGARVHIIPGLAWVSYTRTIQDYGKGRLTFSSPICGSNPAYCPRPGNRYFLYGSLALLTSPGQWYEDPAGGRIYLWPPDGRDPALHLVEIARRKAVIRDDGYSHVEIRDLYTFSGGIKVSGCVACVVDGVHQRYVQHFSEVQGYSAENPVNSLYQGSGCVWADGSIEGSSGDGLAVSGLGQRVHDMLIHDVCRDASYASALSVLGRDQRIDDNTFYDSGRYLINLGSSQAGLIAHNDLYQAGLLTKDVGAIYSYHADGAGTLIEYNHVHSVASTRGIGIYLDNGDSNYIVSRNLVDGCAWSAIELNLPSDCNMVCKNTLWDCKHWVWADGAPHSMTGTVLADNLYSGTALVVDDAKGPIQAGNAGWPQPARLFEPGSFSLAKGSLAIASGVAIPPYTDGGRGAAPDLGAFDYACGPAWTSGCARKDPAFPYPLPEPKP